MEKAIYNAVDAELPEEAYSRERITERGLDIAKKYTDYKIRVSFDWGETDESYITLSRAKLVDQLQELEEEISLKIPRGLAAKQAELTRDFFKDSIFDNGVYVSPDASVSDHIKNYLSKSMGCKVTLLARDGATLSGISSQLARLPSDTTHVFISAGGNDALGELHRLRQPTKNLREALVVLGDIRSQFEKEYSNTNKSVKSKAPKSATGKPKVAVCNIYNPRPDAKGTPRMHPEMGGVEEGDAWKDPEQIAMEVGLSLYNDVIWAVAAREGIPVINVREMFCEAADYSTPIEPGVQGGGKLARAILRVVEKEEFDGESSVYI
ncbi:hypothetical protein HDV00_006784 [Rhizophlyctis rosea]|nr:hypothetical protein HDV00_006784 [Rhizophlyctis rosea]